MTFILDVDYGSGDFYPVGHSRVQHPAPQPRDDTCVELGRREMVSHIHSTIREAQRHVVGVAAQYEQGEGPEPRAGFDSLIHEALTAHEVVYWHHGAGVRYLTALAGDIGADAAVDADIEVFATTDAVQDLEVAADGSRADAGTDVRYVGVPGADGWRYRLSDSCLVP